MNANLSRRVKVLILWVLVVAIALPAGWALNDFLGGPPGVLVWCGVLLGAQWILLRLLAVDVNWAALLLGSGGPVVGFEACVRAPAGDVLVAAGLVALAPILALAVAVLIFLAFMVPFAIVQLVSFALGSGAERRIQLRRAGRHGAELVKRAGWWYLVYLIGVLLGVGSAVLADGTVGVLLLANDAYLGHLVVRAVFGAVVSGYAWAVSMLAVRREKRAEQHPAFER
jgi:hypothetical protein